MVERIYGVVHGETEYTTFRSKHRALAPTTHLVADLRQLPSGTRVGVEYHPDVDRDENYNIRSMLDTEYWRLIIDACRAFGLEVEYLDDIDTLKEMAAKRDKLIQDDYDQYREREYDYLSAEDPDLFENPPPLTALERYVLETEHEYLNVIIRDEKILEKMGEARPDVAIIGRGHGDYYQASQRDRLQAMGLTTVNYVRLHPYYGLDTKELEDTETIERELLSRRRRAIHEGRVTDIPRPNFIGTFDVYCPPKGLFEIFQEGNSFSGVMEDVLGTATFGGKLTGDSVIFTKEYIPDKAAKSAYLQKIQYTGVSGDDITYSGEFNLGRSYRGRFSMRKVEETK